ncbi:hypothetical protein [uncultured Roseobacter sp.]|uniref:hypothetical protein n=1 Tax=uncultured Roseobacter sp. TaxID=114847 RepID=UPI002606F158|nr:hypothetical protein [uncultured Roseobacter sp.]
MNKSKKKYPVGPGDFVDGQAITTFQALCILSGAILACFVLGYLLAGSMSDQFINSLRRLWLIGPRVESYSRYSPISVPYYIATLIVSFPTSIGVLICFKNRYLGKKRGHRNLSAELFRRALIAMSFAMLIFMIVNFMPISDPNGVSAPLFFPALPVLGPLAAMLLPVGFMQFFPWIYKNS